MRRVVILVYPEVQTLDVIGPAEVFRTATEIAGDGHGYEVELVAPERGPLLTSSVSICADRSIAACRGPIDTLLVAVLVGIAVALVVTRWGGDGEEQVAGRVPPKVASSLTWPFTLTLAPRVGVRPCWDTTVTSPVPSSTL